MSFIPKSRRGSLWRFAIGAVVVIAFTAATTAVAGLLQIKQIVTYLNETAAFKNVPVKLPNPGDPQTILVIGSDHRAGTAFNSANTDTMMLIRLDASSSTINVISIPRDLKVTLPTGGGGQGTFKLNAAYSFGGPKLLITTLQQQVFPGLIVNHVLDVNFGGFEDLVNAIGCVYADVDHRYYNNTAVTDYSSIDIQPGYQKLCGMDALAFVRFRHTDSDIVRNARQQDFIRWAKDQFSVGQLFNERDKLLKIFGAHVQTDRGLHSEDGLINLFDLVLGADAHALKQIPFPAILGPCGGTTGGTTPGTVVQTPCYVFADPAAEHHAFVKFMTPTQPVVASSSSAGARHRRRTTPTTVGLTADVSDGRAQAAALRKVRMPVYFPRLIVDQSQYCSSQTSVCPLEAPSPGSYPRGYEIHAQGGGIYPAYRMTLAVNPVLGEYYGVQGTTWQHPPILTNPTQTKTVAGKQLALYFNGAHLSLVAWRSAQGAYWISNTLTDSIPNGQMVGLAASLMK